MFTPPGIHVQWVDQEAVVLNEDTSEVHYLNPPAALIYALVLEYGMPGALRHAYQRMDGSEKEVAIAVQDLVRSLLDKGLLAEVPG